MEASNAEDLPNPTLKDKEQKLYDLFYQSFRFSQGDTLTQESILEWMAVKGYLDPISDLITSSPPPYILEITAPGKHTDEAGQKENAKRTEEIKKAWQKMYYANTSGRL